eukprot:2041490-Heterocapsa_arctica.AAC.1
MRRDLGFRRGATRLSGLPDTCRCSAGQERERSAHAKRGARFAGFSSQNGEKEREQTEQRDKLAGRNFHSAHMKDLTIIRSIEVSNGSKEPEEFSNFKRHNGGGLVSDCASRRLPTLMVFRPGDF